MKFLPSLLSPSLLATLALSIGSSLIFSGCSDSEATPATNSDNPPPEVTFVRPTTREVIDWDEFTGRLVSPQSVEIRARVSGYLQEVHFTEGAEIEEGTLLFTIDPRPYQAIVDRREAGVTSARSRVELTETELKNVTALKSSGAISAEDFERRAKAAADALGILQAAEAELREAKLDLEFTEVRSPITGRVSDARIQRGNLVTGGDQDSNLLTTVVALDPIYCHIEVDERSVQKYRQLHREGKRISAQFGRVDAEMELAIESGFPHKGYIDFVDNELDPATGTIRARAVFPNPDKLMAPGFFARVRVPGSGKYEGLLIPDRAIADDQGTSFVWVLDDDNIPHYRQVTLGPLLNGERIIREGVSKDDRIIVDGLMAVRQGELVSPMELSESQNANAADESAE